MLISRANTIHTTNPTPNLGFTLDDAQVANQITGAGVAGVAGAVNAGMITSTWVAAAIPVVGAVVAGVALALTILKMRKKPGQKIATTQIVNELEPELARNRDGYFSGPRTVASKVVALANFDAAWAQLVEICSDESYGEPGSWCIEDRMPYGMQYTSPVSNRTWIGNGKWDWYSYYRNPIANDTPNPNPADPGTGGQYVVGTDPLTGHPLYTASSPLAGNTWIILGLVGGALLLSMGSMGGNR